MTFHKFNTFNVVLDNVSGYSTTTTTTTRVHDDP